MNKQEKSGKEKLYTITFEFNRPEPDGKRSFWRVGHINEKKVFSLCDKTYGDCDANKWFKVDEFSDEADKEVGIIIINLNAVEYIHIKEEK